MTTTPTIGVVVGRFQTIRLHEGHLHLLRSAAKDHDRLLVAIGSPRSLPTPRNPLSFEIRKAMVEEVLPEAIVIPVFDNKSDQDWSLALDKAIAAVAPGYAPTLYGSRDSFIPYYSGSCPIKYVEDITSVSGSDLRARCVDIRRSEDFRHGVIHAHATRHPLTYPAIDIAIVKPKEQLVLLGEKRQDGGKLRFIGGFVDAEDPSYEYAAKREAYEETGGLEIADLRYAGSARIDDWRYRGVKDGIMTILYRATYVFGAPTARDDLDGLTWVPYGELTAHLTKEHEPLGRMFLKTL
jgi:bifunctional NMN adenylyltransferase/nudix hydrolase